MLDDGLSLYLNDLFGHLGFYARVFGGVGVQDAPAMRRLVPKSKQVPSVLGAVRCKSTGGDGGHYKSLFPHSKSDTMSIQRQLQHSPARRFRCAFLGVPPLLLDNLDSPQPPYPMHKLLPPIIGSSKTDYGVVSYKTGLSEVGICWRHHWQKAGHMDPLHLYF